MKTLLRLLFVIVIMTTVVPSAGAADDDRCDPAAMLRAMTEDPAMADQTMALTVKALVLHLDCKLDNTILKSIMDDPASAELLLMEKAPDCADKIQGVYQANSEKSRDLLKSVIVDVVGYMLTKQGCPEQRDAVEALVERDFEQRVLQNNFLNCVLALHRIKTAERFYYSENNEFTDDINELAPLLTSGETRDAETAETEIGTACCAAADCDAENPDERWNGDFGIDLDENGDYAIYGYPIGGPNCLIEVTQEGDNPETFDACCEESRSDKSKDDSDEEENTE